MAVCGNGNGRFFGTFRRMETGGEAKRRRKERDGTGTLSGNCGDAEPMDRREGLAFFFGKTQPVEDQLSGRELSVADGCASVPQEHAQSRDRVSFRKTQPVEDQLSERELSVADGCASVLQEHAQSRGSVFSYEKCGSKKNIFLIYLVKEEEKPSKVLVKLYKNCIIIKAN